MAMLPHHRNAANTAGGGGQNRNFSDCQPWNSPFSVACLPTSSTLGFNESTIAQVVG